MYRMKTYLNTSETKCILNVLCHPEGHFLRHPQTAALLETDVVVHMDHLPRAELHQQVIKMTVPQPNDVANHAHDSSGTVVGLSHRPPF